MTALETPTRAADELFRNAHTTYRFDGRPIPEETLREIYEVTRWAPTAINSQPLRIAFVTSDPARDRLIRHAAPGNVAKIASAPATAVLAYDTHWHEHLPRTAPHMEDPVTAWQDTERRVKSARFNASIQAGYFILAARTLGLATGPMGGFDNSGVDAEFFPDGRWRSLLLVNLGYPTADGTRPRQPRLDFAEAALIL